MTRIRQVLHAVPWPAVRGIARVEVREAWRALALLGLVCGVVGGLVLGAVVAAERTETAYPRLTEHVGLDDARAHLPADVPAVAAGFPTLPGVEESWVAYAWIAQIDGPALRYVSVVAGPDRPADLVEPVILDGRAPYVQAADELLVGEPFAAAVGLRVGDTITLKMLTLRQIASFDVGFGAPAGATRTMRVVGIGRMPAWGGALGDALSTPAFAAQNHGAAGGRSGFARLTRTGDPAVDDRVRADFAAALATSYDGLPRPQITGQYVPKVPIFPSAGIDPAVSAAERVLRLGLWGFGLVVGLGGLLVLGQGLLRHHSRGWTDQQVENALGLGSAERVAARVLAALPAAVVAGLVGAGVALAAGLVEPLGSQARFEPAPGFRPQWDAVLLGGLAVGAVFAGLVAASASLAGRRVGARSSLGRRRQVDWTRRWPALFVGLRLAMRGRGAPAGAVGMPTPVAAAGVALTVAGIVAAVMFGSSLQRLVDTPARYGYIGDLTIADAREDDMTALLTDPRVAGLDVVETARTTVGTDRSRQTDAYAHDRRKGALPVTMVGGHAPERTGEVAVGARLATRQQLAIGDVVEVRSATGRAVALTVTGIAVPQPERGAPLGEGILVTPNQMVALRTGPPLASAQVQAVPGQAASLYADLSTRLEVHPPDVPTEIDTLAGLLRLPELLAMVLAAVAVAGLVHTLLTAVRRHARDAAVLSVLGATPGQVRATLGVLAGTIVLPGVVGGVLLGLGAGRVLWWQVASAAGVAGDVAVPVWPLLATVPLVLVGALLLSAVPTARAARIPVAAALRAR
ncbi:MAG: hypothetical protein OJJ54_01925 [Pseudonocardia sp.]|nr:hypothetical protein [Pseudonocardia sp.]